MPSLLASILKKRQSTGNKLSVDFKIVYLADHSEMVPTCAAWAFNTWGKYNSSYTLDKRIKSFSEHCNKDQLPLTIIALNREHTPVGMSSLRSNDGIRPDLSPWLGSVYVEPAYRNRGIAGQLVRQTHCIAQELGIETIYLLTYESTLPTWYSKLGWTEMGKDVCHGNPVDVMQIELKRGVS